jgi:hypothetical protein
MHKLITKIRTEIIIKLDAKILKGKNTSCSVEPTHFPDNLGKIRGAVFEK